MEEQVAWRSRWHGGAGGMEEQVARLELTE